MYWLSDSFKLIAELRRIHGPSQTAEIEPPITKCQKLLAKAFHFALYILMVRMPIAGWLILSAEAKPIPFFDFNLP